MSDKKEKEITPLYKAILKKGENAFKRTSMNKDKRAFKSAYDATIDVIDDADDIIEKYYLDNAGEYKKDMQSIIDAGLEKVQAEMAQTFLKSEYKRLFDEELKTKE